MYKILFFFLFENQKMNNINYNQIFIYINIFMNIKKNLTLYV